MSRSWGQFFGMLYLYGMQFFPCLHNFSEGIKNICQVCTFINQEGLVMTRLKELGRSGNYVLWNSTWPRLWINSQRGGFCWNYFVVVQPKQRMFRITRWRSSGVPIEKIRTTYCSNLLDRNSAWSPSRNSKHALLLLNNDKIVPPRCEEIHSRGHVEFPPELI